MMLGQWYSNKRVPPMKNIPPRSIVANSVVILFATSGRSFVNCWDRLAECSVDQTDSFLWRSSVKKRCFRVCDTDISVFSMAVLRKYVAKPPTMNTGVQNTRRFTIVLPVTSEADIRFEISFYVMHTNAIGKLREAIDEITRLIKY